jgi:hypothetical protein
LCWGRSVPAAGQRLPALRLRRVGGAGGEGRRRAGT